MKKWMIYAKKAPFYDIAKKFNIDPVTARVIRNRDICTDEEINEFLNGGLECLNDPRLLKDGVRSAGIICNAVEKGTHIRVIGDYDVDGVMAVYILIRMLEKLNAVFSYRIPDRLKDGYGINERLVEEAKKDGCGLIITCDNGITAFDAVEKARKLGMDIIITDHHEISREDDNDISKQSVPEADAVVDPMQEDCDYPYKDLCGASVAWKIVDIIYDMKGIEREEALDLLQYAAIATVADVMDCRRENRIIIKEGLKRLVKTDNIGLSELFLQCGIEKDRIDTDTIGFAISPCINAAGRLGSAEDAIELLTAKDVESAAVAASGLLSINDIRKAMTAEKTAEAVNKIEAEGLEHDDVIVVCVPECHESIVGIIAGRIKDMYSRPAFVFTLSDRGVKGSGRSVESFNMFSALCECADLLERFGGHSQAAGLTLKDGDIDGFRKRVNEAFRNAEAVSEDKLMIDAAMTIGYITKELVHDLEKLAPFGKGNMKPLFALKDVSAERPSVLGKKENVCRFIIRDQNNRNAKGIYFGDAVKFKEYIISNEKICVTYLPSINTYNGYEELQLVIKDYI